MPVFLKAPEGMADFPPYAIVVLLLFVAIIYVVQDIAKTMSDD